ncbi:MAG: leucyl/phenylalanyl-tRNA--protein transferase, partial [bacterium]|nr:leucyl/phenylalanyl-tRNA--protein transferase [bacterium]
LWFCPPKRAILFLKDLHIPKSLKKEQKKTTFKFTINTAFQDVINQCALSDKRSTGPGTWITPQMIESYTKLHKKGFVYSVETWDDKELVGGFYGVHIGNMWAGESMFYLKPNASKLAFLFFAENLKEKGIEWIDCQQLTDTFKNFGAKLIDRSEFLKILSIMIK